MGRLHKLRRVLDMPAHSLCKRRIPGQLMSLVPRFVDSLRHRALRKDWGRTQSTNQETAEVPPSFAPIVAAFAKDRHVTRKRMFSSDNVLSVHGKIFAMLVKGKLVVKLPKERVDELVSGGTGVYFDPGHGRLMKEWVAVEAGRSSWVELAREAHRFVKGGKSRT